MLNIYTMKKSILIMFVILILILNFLLIFVLLNIPVKKTIASNIILINEKSNQEINTEGIIQGSDKTFLIDEENEITTESYKEDKELPEWIYLENRDSSQSWMNVYGSVNKNGKPAEAGDKIAVFNDKDILCGIFTIKEQGNYGFMHIYSDDLTTIKVDGASPEDKLHFRFYDKSEKEEGNADVVSGNRILFEEFGKVRVDLRV
jgi:hypothetical protein